MQTVYVLLDWNFDSDRCQCHGVVLQERTAKQWVADSPEVPELNSRYYHTTPILDDEDGNSIQ